MAIACGSSSVQSKLALGARRASDKPLIQALEIGWRTGRCGGAVLSGGVGAGGRLADRRGRVGR